MAQVVASVAVTIVAAIMVGSASAQAPPDPGDSAVGQYVELVPTGKGLKSPGVERERRTPLAPKAKRAVEKSPKKTAKALTTVATSSDYGAPTERPDSGTSAQPSAVPRSPRVTPSPAKRPPLDRTLSATAAAVAPVDDARAIGLLVVLGAIVVAGGAIASRARR
jgi:hypothetical protein